MPSRLPDARIEPSPCAGRPVGGCRGWGWNWITSVKVVGIHRGQVAAREEGLVALWHLNKATAGAVPT